MDVVALDRAAVEASVELVRRATSGDWSRPTPCAGWDLTDLVAHMTVQHHGFAAASEGAGTELETWQPVVADDPVRAYAESAQRVLDAFAAPGVLEGEFWLPEISTEMRFPAPTAIGFHHLDYVVHSWDVARTLGVPVPLGDDIIEPALGLAERIPDDDSRDRPGAAFGHAVPATATTPLDRLVALLGRDPGWTS